MLATELLKEVKAGRLRPVYLVVGEDFGLQSRVLKALHGAVLAGSPVGLNDDRWQASETSAERVIAAARTLPMFGPRRLVSVRGVEHWESTTAKEPKDDGKARSATVEPLERLRLYAEDPAPSSVLILSAEKLDGRRKLVASARKQGWLVSCEPLRGSDLVRFLELVTAERGGKLAPGVANLIVELLGGELAQAEDAVERLCLYAGAGATVTQEHVTECLVRLSHVTVWALTDAVGRRDVGGALAALSELFEAQDEAVRLVGTLAWSTRQLIRYCGARRMGLPSEEATRAAGAAPFKARDLEKSARLTGQQVLGQWLETLARVDRDLKGGSKRPARATLELAVLDLCRPG